MTYQPGDEIEINGTTIVITSKGFRSVRYSWFAPQLDEGAEASYPTIEQAVAHAYRTLGTGECRHGQLQFCPDCHDQES